MPNPSNIKAPIFIGGPGRSGTSWVLRVLGLHRDVQAVLENSLAYAIYREVCASWWSGDFLRTECDGDPRRRVRAVIEAMHAALPAAFPSSRPRWAMKVIWGVESTWGVPLEDWTEAFPQARYIHCMRNPLATLPSMLGYLGKFSNMQSLAAAEQSYLRGHADMLALEKRGVPCLRLRLEDVADHPGRVWRELAEFCGLTAQDIDLTELSRPVNTRAKVGAATSAGTDPRLEWADLSEATLTLARKLGYPVPSGCEGKVPSPRPPQPTVEELQEMISCLAAENLDLREQIHATKTSSVHH